MKIINFSTGTQKIILKILIENSRPVTIEDIERKTNKKRRTIYDSISKINETLQDNDLTPIINKRGKGYYIVPQQKKIVSKLLFEDAAEVMLQPKERVYYILCWLLFPKTEKIYIKKMTEIIEVSRNTIFADLNEAKAELRKYKLILNFSMDQGYYIIGSSVNKRAGMVYFLNYLLNNISYKNLHFLDAYEVREYYKRTKSISTELGDEYEDVILLSLACLSYVINHSKGKIDFSILELDSLGKTKEFKLVNKYFQDFYIHDRLYLAIQLLGSKVSNNLQLQKDETDFQLLSLAYRVVQRFELIGCVQLENKEELINSLYLHFKLSNYYYQLNVNVPCPLFKEIKENYFELFNLVQIACEKVENEFPFPITESEKAYITVHIAGHFKNSQDYFYKKIKVLVICPSGVSTSTLLKREIEDLYANVSVIATTSNQIKNFEKKVDFIISTVMIETEVPFLKVHPILTHDDKARIASMLMVNFKTFKTNEGHLNGFFDLIKKYVPGELMGKLRKEVYDYIQQGNILLEENEEAEIGFFDLLTSNNIRIVEESLDWEEAIQCAGELLLENNDITSHYVHEMIDLVKEYGAYIVLANGVAIAHASADTGAIKMGLALYINKQGIYFENGIKVRYLFVFSSPDQRKGLFILRKIRSLAFKKDVLDKLGKVSDSNQVINILKNNL